MLLEKNSDIFIQTFFSMKYLEISVESRKFFGFFCYRKFLINLKISDFFLTNFKHLEIKNFRAIFQKIFSKCSNLLFPCNFFFHFWSSELKNFFFCKIFEIIIKISDFFSCKCLMFGAQKLTFFQIFFWCEIYSFFSFYNGSNMPLNMTPFGENTPIYRRKLSGSIWMFYIQNVNSRSVPLGTDLGSSSVTERLQQVVTLVACVCVQV